MEESDEEEIIVYVNFEEGTVEKDALQLPNITWKVIGLDSNMPIVQLGDTTFKGEWKDALGTKLLFEDDPSPEQVDHAFTVMPPNMLKYKCQSSKILECSRIFLKPKNDENKCNEADNKINSDLNDSLADTSRDGNDIVGLANSTIVPTESTDEVMKCIAEETCQDMEIDNGV